MLKFEDCSPFENKVIWIIHLFAPTVIFYDLFFFKVTPDTPYIVTKTIFFIATFLYSFLKRKLDFKLLTVQEFLLLNFFVYSAYYSVTIHYSYVFAYIQFSLLTTGLLVIRKKVFPYIMATGFISSILTLNYFSAFPQFIAPAEFKSYITSILFYIFTPLSFTYYFVSLKIEDAKNKEKLFADIGKRLGFILHEVRRPLQVIEDSKATLHGLKEFEEIKEILDLANEKNIVIIREEEDIVPLIDEVLTYYKTYFDQLNIQVNFDRAPLSMDIHRTRFIIVLKNLIKNALEENAVLRRDLRQINISSAGGITIENPCSEKSHKEAKTLISPFYTTKNNISNQGLGLFLVNKLLKEQGIDFKIETRENLFFFHIIV